jgi:poly(3-hydroxybutyrate) depolymerase
MYSRKRRSCVHFLALSALAATLGACTPQADGGGASDGTGGSGAGGGTSGSGGDSPGTGGGATASGGGPGAAGTGGVEPASGTGGTGGASAGQGGQASAETGTGGTAFVPATGGATGTSDAGGDSAGPGPAATRSAGCSSGQGLPDGEGTLMAAGMMRSYRIYLPKNYAKDKAWPLILALHPNGGAGIGFYENAARSPRKLLEEKAVLVLPLARGGGGDWDWRGNLPADITYFDELIGKVKSQLCIDETRIFSMGFSGGASFSGVLGCVRKDIRAIAVAGSVIYFDPKTCVGNPAAWIAIGMGEMTADRTTFRNFWTERATCKAPTMPVMPSPCVAYTCPAERPVHFCNHAGGHEWPSFATAAAVAFFDKF